MTPDGRTLVSVSLDTKVMLWSLPDGKHLQTLTGHTHWVHSLAITPDGKTLASGSADKTIKLWSLPDGKLIRTLEGHTDIVNALVIRW